MKKGGKIDQHKLKFAMLNIKLYQTYVKIHLILMQFKVEGIQLSLIQSHERFRQILVGGYTRKKRLHSQPLPCVKLAKDRY